MKEGLTRKPRIINISNRLPIKTKSEQGNITYEYSEGGLATSLSSVLAHYDNIWMGWIGCPIKEEQQPGIVQNLNLRNIHPVFLSEYEIEQFYEGFSNETLWPLFHYFPTYSNFNPQYWEVYQNVNQKFADELLKFVEEDDIIWVHDYQLMLLPALIRKTLPNITIGYFQHIPFPTHEIFMNLPWRKEILKGLMGADVIGFQTPDDVQHFKDTAIKMLELSFNGNETVEQSRKTIVKSFPISIDYEKYKSLACDELTMVKEQEIRHIAGDIKLAVSVDRLDYSKGIIQRLKAYERFLDKYPQWIGKVTLIHLIVPSRDNVKNYKELKEEMDQLIGNINGRFSTFSWRPVMHFYRSFSPELLSAIYKAADVALVTPLRDGMNLVCKEYVASNITQTGVLVLSEAAGAANELAQALLINPNDTEGFAAIINKSLTLPEQEKRYRMGQLQEIVSKADVFKWAERFITHLTDIKNSQQKQARRLDNFSIQRIQSDYQNASKRLILLDYDGTLTPLVNRPEDACPDKELLTMIRKLTADEHNNVVIISGRDWYTMESWLGTLNTELVAEHGIWHKEKGGQWEHVKELNQNWKKDFMTQLAMYTKLTPGSFVEEKTYSIAWHYRRAEANLGQARAREIADALGKKARATGLHILKGNKVIEIKSITINKGKITREILKKDNYDFILAIGDDTTDEDTFRALPDKAFRIKVGTGPTAAEYRVDSVPKVRALLTGLSSRNNTLEELVNLGLISHS